ncbi:MAG: class I SAM-dependent methyltransferase [Saprospiraceae bacterium]|nr:class I SAM-dependent methyltransferase [Saprospiraceae bacterium]
MENQKDLVKSILLQVAPQLTDAQFNQLLALIPLYQSWNEKINLISRKDMDHFVVHHLLHCISLSKFVHWPAGIKVLDLGTGGGFPAIPLAICFPR